MVKTSPSNIGGAGSIPGQGAKILQDWQSKNQNLQQKQYCNKFNKDKKPKNKDFPGGTVDKNLPANTEDMHSIPDPGRFHN